MTRDNERSSITARERAEFEWYQRERPRLMREIATNMQCWEFCRSGACRRGKACLGEDAAICVHARFHRPMSEEEVQIFYVALELYKGGLTPRAAKAEAARLVRQGCIPIAARNHMSVLGRA